MADGGMNRSAVALGVFFVLAGVAFLLDQLDVWNLRARYFLPSVVIALGVAILIGGRTGGRARGADHGGPGKGEVGAGTSTDGTDPGGPS
jgi:hypothetical protein